MPPRRKRPCKEGDWIAVPLTCGGYAAGLVARTQGFYGLLVYWFGPRYESVPTLEQVEGNQPEQALTIAKVSAMGLHEGTWKVIGRSEHWDRDKWPLPVFGAYGGVGGFAWRVTYDEDDFYRQIHIEPTTVDDARSLPEDSVWGDIYAEQRLSDWLCPSSKAP